MKVSLRLVSLMFILVILCGVFQEEVTAEKKRKILVLAPFSPSSPQERTELDKVKEGLSSTDYGKVVLGRLEVFENAYLRTLTFVKKVGVF